MVARGMTLVPERRELFGEMSVADNLLLGAFSRYRSGQRDQAQTMKKCSYFFRACEIGACNWRAPCRAASGRCSPSGAR